VTLKIDYYIIIIYYVLYHFAFIFYSILIC
jgi:hypothetical protein